MSEDDEICLGDSPNVDYLLLPSTGVELISWDTVLSVLVSSRVCCVHRGYDVETKNGLVCICRLMNSLVYTPHNGHVYCITGVLSELDGNSLLKIRKNEMMPYKEYYKVRYVLYLCFPPMHLKCLVLEL